jgi:hypothetical protein
MLLAHVYLKYEGSLNELASHLKSILNIPDKNISQLEQLREGLNVGGGEYYYFEFFGLEINLISNKGEVLEEEYHEYQYYLYTHTELTVENSIFSSVIIFFVEILKSNDLVAEIEFF